MKTLLLLAVLMACCCQGCNTFSGLGNLCQGIGQDITEASDGYSKQQVQRWEVEE
jgi:predicted small secreted protein